MLLEKYLDCDKYKYVLEYEILYDKVMIRYVVKLEYGVGVVLEMVDEDIIVLEDEGLVLLMGWVLKLVIVIRKNFMVV